MKKHIAPVFVMLMLAACSGEPDYYTGVPRPQPPVVTPPQKDTLIKLPSEWTKATTLMSGFPEGVEVYRRTTAFNGKAMNAYCVVFDPAVAEFKPVVADKNKKSSAYYAEETGTKYACINAGFFGTNVSYSLVKYNGAISAVNIRSLNRPYNGASTPYYPTRAAFGLTASGAPQVSWVYHVGTTVYSYPSPSPNELNKAPEAVPSATFPSGGAAWNVTSAIGGSPVLIYNNSIRITDKEELIDIDNTSSRARSAIGYTATGKVIVLAVEGGNTAGGIGLNLAEVADLMKSMGCTGAINLDGGGSTYMMVNGQQTVKPSDAAGERAVMSAIIIKKK
ncbi:phosphodiester glycosidase family protein [Chitinophaga sedimenti]|uniref:phosphodiester glycosidase family protein n=1 Tax=Chitinophaga sedimenti TaxID=2033606 RepID=UPI0020036582|nr:phosphodiester glycosidase family protein [Chitinophaga sedimenti]MCK7558377.1 phosphodiester glycosidase family protein [Chitinophaga sedimenti]